MIIRNPFLYSKSNFQSKSPLLLNFVYSPAGTTSSGEYLHLKNGKTNVPMVPDMISV